MLEPMRQLLLKLSLVVIAFASSSCGMANSLYETGNRMLQTVGRTVTG
jgi:hypothetical protein